MANPLALSELSQITNPETEMSEEELAEINALFEEDTSPGYQAAIDEHFRTVSMPAYERYLADPSSGRTIEQVEADLVARPNCAFAKAAATI